MKWHFASDLHYGVNAEGNAAVRELASHLRAPNATEDDALVLVGDIATDDDAFRACLALFAGYPGRKFAIPGNHDVWIEAGRDVSSWTRYRRIQRLMRAAGFHPLEEEPAIVGGTAVVGSMGWYDYSFKDEELGISDAAYAKKTYPGQPMAMWNDAHCVRWGMSDAEMVAWQAERLERHLASVAGHDEVLVAIHHVPTKRLLFHPRWMVPEEMRFANAFLGSERFAEIACAHGADLVINGHIHLAGEARIGNTRFVSIGGDYDGKQLVVRENGRVLRRTFTSSGMRHHLLQAWGV